MLAYCHTPPLKYLLTSPLTPEDFVLFYTPQGNQGKDKKEMKTTTVRGQHVLHEVRADGNCSCRFTHPRRADGSWDVTRDTSHGPLTEIAPLEKGGAADIYVCWPF